MNPTKPARHADALGLLLARNNRRRLPILPQRIQRRIDYGITTSHTSLESRRANQSDCIVDDDTGPSQFRSKLCLTGERHELVDTTKRAIIMDLVVRLSQKSHTNFSLGVTEMKIRKLVSLVFVVMFVAMFACISHANANDQIGDLDGEWKVVSWIVDGQSKPDSTIRSAHLSIRNGNFTFTLRGRAKSGEFVMNSEGTNNFLDVDVLAGPDQGRLLLGTYQLNGDLLINCHARSETYRPTCFASERGSGHTLIIYERQ